MRLPRIAVTMGDPAGVGPEICLRMLSDQGTLRDCVPFVFGDAAVLLRVAHSLGLDLSAQCISFAKWKGRAGEIEEPTIVDFALTSSDDVQPGTVDAATGMASYRYVEAAIDAAVAGKVDAVTTGPIHKEALHAAGIAHPGHTEILAEKTQSRRVCMMLTSREITCSLVTTHVGYASVPSLLSLGKIVDAIELSADAMRRLRGREPRLVVCGLNPHAGEHGLFGNQEEEHLIRPAIESAVQMGIDAVGPLPPDTAFLPEQRGRTDCYICMYHDQGLIPLKALAFDQAVNVTLGLPIIRTSVDHGTALDIAWQGKADASSMIEAIRLAVMLSSPSA